MLKKLIGLVLVIVCMVSCKNEYLTKLPYNQEDFIEIKRDFGRQSSSIFGPSKFNKGMVIELKDEAKIYSLTEGIVTEVCDSCKRGKGRRVSISNEGNILVRYYHLSEISVSIGDSVENGQQIGVSGSSGLTTVNGLGLLVKINDSIVNPNEILTQVK